MQVSNVKFLSIYIDENLSKKYHISYDYHTWSPKNRLQPHATYYVQVMIVWKVKSCNLIHPCYSSQIIVVSSLLE